MANCTFGFNAVLTSLELNNPDFQDLQKIQAEVNFCNAFITIRQSGLNVPELMPEYSTDVSIDPTVLRQTLEECGVPVSIRYEDFLVGMGAVRFRPEDLEGIGDSMKQLVLTESCTVERDGKVVGRLEMLCSLQLKCVDEERGKESTCQLFKDKSINEKDILFIMSESQQCTDPCLGALDSVEDSQYLKFGTQSFANENIRCKPPAPRFLHNPVGNAICCEVKEMAQDCNDTVDAITDSLDHNKKLRPPCRGPPDPLGHPCTLNMHYNSCRTPLEESNLRLPCFTRIPPLDPEEYNTLSERKNELLKEKRFCPICLTNLTWLPILAACPKCGLKPMLLPQKPKIIVPDDDLIYSNLHLPPEETPSAEENPRKCRCTCRAGKLCPFCRVREKVADFYDIEKPPRESLVYENSDEEVSEVGVNEADSRPFLSRVLSEIRDLNNIKDIKPFDVVQKECARKEKAERMQAGRLQAGTCGKGEKKPTRAPIERKAPTKRRSSKPNRRISPSHKKCANRVPNIPANHGWNWYASEEALKHGWQPGLVRKPIKKIMKFFLQGPPEKLAAEKCKELMDLEKQVQPPILNLRKKNGEIFITLRALDNPHVTMKPIVFKVVKSDLGVALSQIKKKFKAKGFRKCTCHKPLMMCVCRDIFEKKCLEAALQKECKRRHMESCVAQLVLTDTSDSEMEFDFDVSPPAASPQKYVKPKTHNHETQTAAADLKVAPKYPTVIDPYWRVYDCAAGDRYTGTAFGKPGEPVFEDGLFGHGGGGPHGASAAPGGRPKPPGIWGSGHGGPMRGGAAGGGRGGGGRGGAGGGMGGGHGGPGGMGALFDKSFPGLKKKGTGKSAPIPVRMRDKDIKAVKDAKQAAKDAIKNEIARKKKGIDLIQYLREDGALPKPWDPNNPQPKNPKPIPPVVAPDGLTYEEHKKQLMNSMIMPPLETMPRLGRGYDPCQYYNSCMTPCCYPCCYCPYYG